MAVYKRRVRSHRVTHSPRSHRESPRLTLEFPFLRHAAMEDPSIFGDEVVADSEGEDDFFIPRERVRTTGLGASH